MDELVSAVEDVVPAGTHWEVRHERSDGFSIERRGRHDDTAAAAADDGVGVRVLHRGAWGFAAGPHDGTRHVRELARVAMAAARAVSRASRARIGVAGVDAPARGRFHVPAAHDPAAADPADLVDLVADLWAMLPPGSARTAELSAGVVEKRVATSDGARARVRIPRVRIDLDVTRGDTSLARRLGAAGGFEHLAWPRLEETVTELAEALRLHERARSVPRSALPVLVDPELAGVFAHEAVGHASEADLVIAGESVFAGRIGRRVGTDEVTVVDDALAPGGFGACPVDDEGVPGRRKVLIEKGILRGFIHSRETAHRLGAVPNGGARAEDHASAPMPRMSNTLFGPGSWTTDELNAHHRRCVLAKGTRGGQVDTARGGFQFTPQESYLVERGDVVAALKGAGLSGDIATVLRSVRGAGRDARLGGPGLCGKGQWVPVGDGGPTLLVEGVTIGGS